MDERNSPWQVIKRIFSGQNAFLDPESPYNTDIHHDDWEDRSQRDVIDDPRLIRDNPLANPIASNPLKDKLGRKIIPEIEYQRYHDYLNGDWLTLWVQLKNVSNINLYMQRAEIFGQRRAIGHLIRPGQVLQLKIYEGLAPETTDYNQVRLVYKEMYSGVGDVFCACYCAMFRQCHDYKHYTLRGMMKNGPTQNWW